MMIDDDEVVLIPSTKRFEVRAENEYHEIDPRKALCMLEGFDRRRWMEVRYFAAEARLSSAPLHLMDDQRVLKLIRDRVRDGSLVAIQKGPARPEGTSATMELRRLVAAIERTTQNRLDHRGRRYKLVADVDLGAVPSRNDYVVLSRATADQVLGEMAREAGTPADLRTLLTQACGKLTKDWRPPIQPDGLIMLRREARPVAVSPIQEPAITPSQLRTLMEKAALEIHVVYDEQLQLVDQTTGRPLANYPYVILHNDKVVAQGQTDENGMTARVESGDREAEMTVLWGDDALDEGNNDD